MGISKAVLFIIAIFFCVGAADRIIGGRFGYEREFEEGFLIIGKLCLSMVGVIAIAPTITLILKPVLVKVSEIIGTDPSVFIGMLFPCDMGGYSLSMALTDNYEMGNFSGLIISSTMGNTVLCIIPMAMNILEKEDHRFFAYGTLCGISMVPVGCFVGGVVMDIETKTLLYNLLPLIVFSILLILGLLFVRELCVKIFIGIGKCIAAVINFGLICIALRELMGVSILYEMPDIGSIFTTVGSIAIILAGAYPLCFFLKRICREPMMKIESRYGLNQDSVNGFILVLANNAPMLSKIKDMDSKGKIYNVAFAIGAAYVLGDDLAFCAGVSKEMIVPVMTAKTVTGVTALFLAILLFSKKDIA